MHLYLRMLWLFATYRRREPLSIWNTGLERRLAPGARVAPALGGL